MALAKFEPAYDFMIEHEVGPYRKTGGYVNHPADPGGATKWGISLRYVKLPEVDGDVDQDGDEDEDDIRAMPEAHAKKLYRQMWDRVGQPPGVLNKVKSQAVANKIFDMVVNMGEKRAVRLVQRTFSMVEDGVLGPRTLAAINTADSEILVQNIRCVQRAFYECLVEASPRRSVFLKGWLRRAEA